MRPIRIQYWVNARKPDGKDAMSSSGFKDRKDAEYYAARMQEAVPKYHWVVEEYEHQLHDDEWAAVILRKLEKQGGPLAEEAGEWLDESFHGR